MVLVGLVLASPILDSLVLDSLVLDSLEQVLGRAAEMGEGRASFVRKDVPHTGYSRHS